MWTVRRTAEWPDWAPPEWDSQFKAGIGQHGGKNSLSVLRASQRHSGWWKEEDSHKQPIQILGWLNLCILIPLISGIGILCSTALISCLAPLFKTICQPCSETSCWHDSDLMTSRGLLLIKLAWGSSSSHAVSLPSTSVIKSSTFTAEYICHSSVACVEIWI